MAPRRVWFVVYDGFELLDLAGTLAVFTSANELAGERLYEVGILAGSAGVTSSGGIGVTARLFAAVRPRPRDSVLVVGATAPAALRSAAASPELQTFLRGAAQRAGRIGSICSGAFVLAAAGLLDGRRATTHWAGCAELARRFPRVEVAPDALYVEDGPVWTSAGVTTGIDMALAILAREHGAALMGRVARHLVVYAHRPGHQSQFSDVLDAQLAVDSDFSGLVAWLLERLDRPLSVAAMAAHVGMSERTFRRRFAEAAAGTPAALVDRLRVDRARLALASGDPVKRVAARVGFRSEAAFRTFFQARVGITPGHYARMHRA